MLEQTFALPEMVVLNEIAVGKHCAEIYSVTNAKAMDSLSLFTQTIKPDDISKYPHLSDLVADLTLTSATPKILLGAEHCPCTALYIKNRNAQELQKSYPAAAKAIVHEHYMDDYLGSLDDVREATQLAADIVTVHKAAGVLNVADDATRLKNRDIDLSRWFSGPDFLLLPSSEWPKEPSMPEATSILEELKPSKVHCANKFRSLLAHNSPNSKTINNSSPFKLTPLSAMEIQKAEIAILRKAQTDSFSEEISLLRDSKPLPKSSKLKSLCPIFDEDGLLRLDSRIKHMKNTDYATTSPIILDGRHPAVRLLVHHYHVQAAHAFNELVTNELKQRFWIFRCRSEVRMASRRCTYCTKRKATPHIPPTGDLPDVRLEHHQRPFTNTGLDYFGPVEVSIGRRREKRWIALFTCMTTRAVHLEIVTSLSADSAIMSIRRFAARRGLPTKILSDNGTSFVGANRQMCEFYSDGVQDFAASKCIEWCFIPPAAPFMGGCWERLVKTVKSALLVTLKERSPREELLHTLLLEAEALVNSRPLTYVTENGQYESLTPFHFLIGTSSNQQTPAD
ncbi:uncharacterized protein [Choristoneura fumiferana]|uniref:uncharacterized protein n=1 Tax=Choristoneura fumiferana TaxID=7141 RepID=UPI003D156469